MAWELGISPFSNIHPYAISRYLPALRLMRLAQNQDNQDILSSMVSPTPLQSSQLSNELHLLIVFFSGIGGLEEFPDKAELNPAKAKRFANMQTLYILAYFALDA